MSRLCIKCDRLFTGKLLTGLDIYADASRTDKFRHHDNVNALERSALDGCPSCRVVMSYINPHMLAVLRPPPDTGTTHLYRVYADMVRHDQFVYTHTRRDYKARFILTFSAGPNRNEMNYEEIEMYWNGAGNQPTLPMWSDSTDSGKSWMCVQQWLGICMKYHTKCTPQRTNIWWNPTRLLDLGPERANLPLRLIERREIPPGAQYTTLSHCWGNTEVVKLRGDNMTQMKNSIPLQTLSKTFQDAVEVTRRLRIRYLWIDSLCIIQDSPQDWEAEALQMEVVYSNCFFNIAATHSENGEGGLFAKRDPLRYLPARIYATYDGEEPVYLMCINANSWVEDFEREPLHTRGWVIQERIFSPRICHFTSNQVIWECNEVVAFEKFAHGPSAPGHAFSMPELKGIILMTEAKPETWQSWSVIMGCYTAAKLSFETDKLVAISGIVRRVQRLLETEYLAGLWREDIEYQLTWKLKTLDSGQILASRPAQYIAPTWSWASTNGVEVELPSRPYYLSSTFLLANVMQFQVRPERSTTTCNDGFLQLLCFMVPVLPKFHDLKNITIVTAEDGDSVQTQTIKGIIQLDVPLDTTAEFTYFCLPIVDGEGHAFGYPAKKSFLLQGIIVSRNEGEFRRCGWFSVLESEKEKYQFWKWATRYGNRAIEEGWQNVALYDEALLPSSATGGVGYQVAKQVPKFLITIK